MIRPVVTVDREALEVVISRLERDTVRYSHLPEVREAREALRRSLTDAPAPGEDLSLDGSAILLDSFGAVLARTENTDRIVVVIDLEGAVAGTDGAQRDRRRFLAPPAMTAELVVRLLTCGREDVSREAFLEALESLAPGAVSDEG